jgi:transposase
MRPNPSSPKSAAKPIKKPAEAVVKDIRRATRRLFSAEDTIRIVLEGLRGEASSLATIPRMVASHRHCRTVPP